MVYDDVTQKDVGLLLPQPIKKDGLFFTTANRMQRNCQEDIRFCYDIRGISYYKYDPCYAVPRR